MKRILHFITCILLLHQVNAQTWIPQGHGLLPLGYTIWSISAVDDTVIWATASLGSVALSGDPVPLDHKLKVLRSIDGGLTWLSHDAAAGRFSLDIIAEDANTAWITTETYGNGIANALFKTEDGGLTWTNKLIHPAAGVFIRRFDDTHLLCQSDDKVARSSNDGEDWTIDTIQPYLPNEFNAIVSTTNMACVVGDTLWVGTNLGRVVRLTNYGASYEMIYTGFPYYILSISFADHLRGILYYYDFNTNESGLLHTVDGGTTWELTPTKPNTARAYSVAFVPGTSGTFITISNYIFFAEAAAEYFWTTDFGNTWVRGGDIKDAQTNCIQFSNPTLGWASSSVITRKNEPIVYRWLGDIFTRVNNNPEPLTGFEISPNPATTTIHYQFDRDDHLLHEQTVIALNGRVLQSVMTSSSELNVSVLPAGVYFLKIKTGQGEACKLFVKQ